MSHSSTGTAAGEAGPAGQQPARAVRLAGMLSLSFCDAGGLGALARMSEHARQAGTSVHLVAPPPRLMKVIRITGLQEKLPAHRGDQAEHVQVA